MKKNQFVGVTFVILSIFLNITVAYSLNYTINFTGSGVTTPLDSVIVKNITKGTRAIIYGDGILNLQDEPNSIEDVTSNDETIHIYQDGLKGESILSFYAKKMGYVQINAYNLNGVQIAGLNTLVQTGKNSFELSLPKGISIIQVVGNEYKYTAKTCNFTGSQSKPRIAYILSEKSTSNGSQKSKNITRTNMSYTANDFLVFIGKSGNYVTTITDIPTTSKTINFNFLTNESLDFVTFSDGIIPSTWQNEGWKIDTYAFDDNNCITGDPNGAQSIITVQKTIMNDSYIEFYDCGVYSSYFNSDYYSSFFFIDNVSAIPYYQKVVKSNWSEWKQRVYVVPAGVHTFKWVIETNAFYRGASLDAVNFTPTPVLATISTINSSNIKANSIKTGGNVVFDGYSKVSAKGVCWSTVPKPTQNDTKTIDGSGIGSFTSTIENLIPNTIYYARAYATDIVGTSYGNEITFTTPLPSLASLSTTLVELKSNSAIVSGDITLDGNATIIQKGICWSISPNPTIDDNKTNDGTGTGTFTTNLDNLTPNTTYYIRAYATNLAGTAYGNELSFTTPYFYTGQNYQGGIIAYIDGTGQHGIIAAPFDQGVNISWGNGLNIPTGATDSLVGSGLNNTLKIVNAFGSGNYAARVCYDLVLNGYDDWFLPSSDELEKLYLTQEIIGGYNGSCSSYVSSTEHDINKGFERDFFLSGNGEAQGLCRGWDVRIRAIRYF